VKSVRREFEYEPCEAEAELHICCNGPRDCGGTDRGCLHCAPGKFNVNLPGDGFTPDWTVQDMARAALLWKQESERWSDALHLLMDELRLWHVPDMHIGPLASYNMHLGWPEVRAIKEVLKVCDPDREDYLAE
jgi:hypothetical protein